MCIDHGGRGSCMLDIMAESWSFSRSLDSSYRRCAMVTATMTATPGNVAGVGGLGIAVRLFVSFSLASVNELVDCADAALQPG